MNKTIEDMVVNDDGYVISEGGFDVGCLQNLNINYLFDLYLVYPCVGLFSCLVNHPRGKIMVPSSL